MKHKFKGMPSALRITLVIVTISVFFCIAYFCFEGFILDYTNRSGHQAVYLNENGYTKELGVATLEYEDIQDAFGSPVLRTSMPDQEYPEVEWIEAVYPGFVAYYTASKDVNKSVNYYTYLITITSEEYQFGWLRIGINSPRIIVHLAYFLERKISAEELAYSAMNYPNVDEGFYGENWSRILFCYNDENKVESIAYEPSIFY